MLTIIDQILNAEAVRKIKNGLKAHSFMDGRETARGYAAEVKNNQQLDPVITPEAMPLSKIVLNALQQSQEFYAAAQPRYVLPPRFARYHPGMNYGMHVDQARITSDLRSDISVTVFLNEPGEYEGGELHVESPFGPVDVKLPAGSAVVYPSSTLHEVSPVTKGERLVAITWVQSFVRSPEDRELLIDIDRINKKLRRDSPDSEEFALSRKVLNNLIRRFSEG